MSYQYDLVVIGGGSGGIATARRAAEYGARVALVEAGRLGGTCVNVGCVPKKLMWNAAELVGSLADARGYGFDVTVAGHDWAALKAARDAYVTRLNGIYETNLAKSKVTVVRGWGRLLDAHTIEVGDERLTAGRVVLAPGGRPHRSTIPGAELSLDSDGFFALAARPQRVTVVGGGFIAVELAGVFAALGSEVSIVVRGSTLLREFDPMLVEAAQEGLQQAGAKLITQAEPTALERGAGGQGIEVSLSNGERLSGQDAVIFATGRDPITDFIDSKLGLRLNKRGFIEVDEFQQTSVPEVFAIGDVTGQVTLTPVAIAAGRRLADRIWGGMEGRRLSYENIPSVLFGHPALGTVGLTEPQARARYGDAVKCFTCSFVPMYYAFGEAKPKTRLKLVTVGPEQRVVGVHLAGREVAEMLQGFAVAVKMGATKRDFDDTVAIHPTAAEELVTMR
ncbi:MAG TPA: glutathione-disulfide reductase [Steroidobacteraceae bacterium]|nr:glutathione-disulfide reductase [Steroidobacteraceae bacterium]